MTIEKNEWAKMPLGRKEFSVVDVDGDTLQVIQVLADTTDAEVCSITVNGDVVFLTLDEVVALSNVFEAIVDNQMTAF